VNLHLDQFTCLQLIFYLREQGFRHSFLSYPDRCFSSSRPGQEPSQLALFERRSLTVGYLFFVPQSRHVINTVVPYSDLVLTRQFTPGTRSPPQPRQMRDLCSPVMRTPAFIPILRANAIYRLASSLSVEKTFRAWASRISTRSRAISFVPAALLQANTQTSNPSAECSCNLFVSRVENQTQDPLDVAPSDSRKRSPTSSAGDPIPPTDQEARRATNERTFGAPPG